MHATDSLFHSHGIPRQVLVKEDSSHLEVHSFPSSRCTDEKAGAIFLPEVFHGSDLVLNGSPLNCSNPAFSKDAAQFIFQKFKGVSVLGENDELL
jgi:S-adenosylmethionine/arginine decarboxylase-like enzyme